MHRVFITELQANRMTFHPSSATVAKPAGVVATQACLDRIREQEHAQCLMCGPENPSGLKVKFKVQPDGSVAAAFDCLPMLQSYPSVLHGGVISALLDSAMASALFAIGVVAVTAALEIRFLAPTSTGRFAMVRAWTESAGAHPLYLQRAELIQDGKVVVEAKAKFIVREAL
jgi:acyl-coenzyme A thioesterase PaaI-like protein